MRLAHLKSYDVIKQQILAARSRSSSGEIALPVSYHIHCALFIFAVVCRMCVQVLGVLTRLAKVGYNFIPAICHHREHMAQATVDGDGTQRPRKEKNKSKTNEQQI